MRRRAQRTGGAEGNERLTAATALVLLGLLAVEGVTILFIRPLISMHVFVGMLLIPPVALKLASTGYRFMRYYRQDRDYVAKGPPHPLMRFLVAPALVLSTIGVFATGVAILALGQRQGPVVGLHKASFVIWFGAMAIHVLVYSPRLLRLLHSERLARRRPPGTALRGSVILGALAAGLVVAFATIPSAHPLLHGRWRNEEGARLSPGPRARGTAGAPSARRQEARLRVRGTPATSATRAGRA